MRICLLADGKSIHTMRWVNYFLDVGHEVHLISIDDTPLCKTVENLNFHSLKGLATHKIWFFVPIIRWMIFSIKVKKIISKINPDILHAHYLADYGIIGALTGFHPFIVSIWGSDVLVAPINSKAIKMMESHALKKSDLIMTIPEFMKDYLGSKFNVNKDKVVRLAWGIDLDIYSKKYEENVHSLKRQLKIKKNSSIIISNRSMGPHYNIEKIIEAIPQVLQVSEDAIFIFVKGYGSSEYVEKIKSKVEYLGISDNIRIIEKILSPQEMAIHLNMADMIISIPKTDQFSSSILEGMACGAVPIVGNLNVYKQYLKNGENAFFVNADNPIDISQKIIHCIEKRPLKDIFYKLNINIVEENENWATNANAMIQIYQHLIGEIQNESKHTII